jgi:hypothetical protein
MMDSIQDEVPSMPQNMSPTDVVAFDQSTLEGMADMISMVPELTRSKDMRTYNRTRAH